MAEKTVQVLNIKQVNYTPDNSTQTFKSTKIQYLATRPVNKTDLRGLQVIEVKGDYDLFFKFNGHPVPGHFIIDTDIEAGASGGGKEVLYDVIGPAVVEKAK
jgi:hypothetical protein